MYMRLLTCNKVTLLYFIICPYTEGDPTGAEVRLNRSDFTDQHTQNEQAVNPQYFLSDPGNMIHVTVSDRAGWKKLPTCRAETISQLISLLKD